MQCKKIVETLNFRHACKVFDEKKKISEDDFNCILESARLSPSSFGFEPWRFLIVQDKALREELKKVTWGAQGQLPMASHFCIILARKDMRYDSEYIQNFIHNVQDFSDDVIEKRLSMYKQFQTQDFKLLESSQKMFEWACRQTYIALTDMMYTAALLKIDSCAIEGFNPDMIDALLEKKFGVDTETFGISCMAAFGYRINPPQKKTRQKIEKIVEWH